MKTFLSFIIVLMLTVMAAPVYASPAVQIFACEEGENATEEKMEELASKWLKAARSMKGGENLRAFIYYPSVANLKGGDLLFMVMAPSHAEWGQFWDGYKDSPAEKADAEARGIVICPDSNLFEVVEIK